MKDLENTAEFANSEFTNLEDRTREDNRLVTMKRIRAWFRTTLAKVRAHSEVLMLFNMNCDSRLFQSCRITLTKNA